MRFIDETNVIFASGKGGNGAVSFLREKFVSHGGPDGGDGGRGGHLILVATRRKNTLIDFRRNKTYEAHSGLSGGKRRMTGRSGKDLELSVPIGTIIYREDNDEVLADLNHDGARWVLEGGGPGKGNIHFKTAQRRTPRISTPGSPGTVIPVRMELKLLADVGLLGFPNAGKSTLISAVSAARPRIADYPFTTLVPHLGVVRIEEDQSFVVADIPGLIEGAADGVGLGHQFLKHVERCALYMHLVSAYDPDHPSPEDRYNAINRELFRYDKTLIDRPQLVVLSRADMVSPEEAQDLANQLTQACGKTVRVVSSVTREGLKELMMACWHEVTEIQEKQLAALGESPIETIAESDLS
jgi:GTP-binding protein